MWKHLWTNHPPPSEWIIVQLCDRFGAAVLELDAELVETMLALLEVEANVTGVKKFNKNWKPGKDDPEISA